MVIPTDYVNILDYDTAADAQSSSASSAASWLNPRYTSWDPILISGTTFTASATTPSVAVTSTTSSKTSTATAISATSCDLAITSASTYCNCEGGFGVSLSTKTNAAKSTFLVCAADPPLTVSTIKPTSTTTTKTTSKTTTTPSATATGFLITYVECESSICPIGQTCDSNGEWDFMAVQPLVDDAELVQISGTYNKGGMVSGSKAKFCDQTSTFTTDGKLVDGSSSDGSYGSYSCKVAEATVITVRDPDVGTVCSETYKWYCLTDMCL